MNEKIRFYPDDANLGSGDTEPMVRPYRYVQPGSGRQFDLYVRTMSEKTVFFFVRPDGKVPADAKPSAALPPKYEVDPGSAFPVLRRKNEK